MSLYFYREDFCGRVARQVLCAPTLTRNYDKRFPGRHSPRVEIFLPPRLSLRSLAGHRTLAYFVLAIVVAHFWGCGPITFTFIIFTGWALYLAIKALTMPWLQRMRSGPGLTRNLSPNLNDSMLDVSFTTS